MIAAPAKTPRPILDKIHGEAKSVVAMQDVKDQIITDGMLPVDNPSIAELQGFVNSEIIRWSKIVQQAGIAGPHRLALVHSTKAIPGAVPASSPLVLIHRRLRP